MDIRQLQYLVALAREKHFTRAASACNVTQPTLSGRIRQLELELGVPIVERGQRYQGLTPEGERILKWAQVILNSWQSMQQELTQLNAHDSSLTGRLTLGGIPSALPMIPFLTKNMRDTHPGIDFTVMSHSSEEILRGLADFSIDVGITYLDNEPIEGLLASPLYQERYCLFVPRPASARGPARRDVGRSRQGTALPPHAQICKTGALSTERSSSANCHPAPRLETNSVINLCANVRLMGLASIMPALYHGRAREHVAGIKAIPLIAPEVDHSVGLGRPRPGPPESSDRGVLREQRPVSRPRLHNGTPIG